MMISCSPMEKPLYCSELMTACFILNLRKTIDDVILSLKDYFLLEREENMAGCLDINITRDEKNNSLTMTQTGLIKRILIAIDMKDCNHEYTPADKYPLRKDVSGAPCCENWNYRSIVGMMLYLAGGTRPDISYAVNQCARFSHGPKRSHEIGVKHIARYLKRTQKKGIIMTPNSNKMRIDVYANADFSGLYNTAKYASAYMSILMLSLSGVMMVPFVWVPFRYLAMCLTPIS